jgi:zinc transporter
VVSLIMAWSPFQRANAGIIGVEQPGDYANPIPTTSATGPQAAHSVLTQLEQNRGESVLQAYRDLGSRVRQRVDAFRADLHLQADRARLLQEEVAAQLATATNRNLFALTVVTTLLLPPAFVTGLFGMNTKGLPFADSDYGTIYATIICVLAAGVAYLLIRRYRAVS